jgi:hypothetical protein
VPWSIDVRKQVSVHVAAATQEEHPDPHRIATRILAF